MKISQLFIYPIKSLGGISIEESNVETRGLQYDRRWVLVDENNRFISQRENINMSAIKMEIDNFGFIAKNILSNSQILIPFKPQTNNIEKISIWEDVLEAVLVSDLINEWFSNELNQKVRLFYQPDSSIRKIDPNYSVNGLEHTNLSDGYPILLISNQSLENLNFKLKEKVSINRFRPNIVFNAPLPFFEDEIKLFKINEIQMYGVKPCGRCQIITINQETQTTSNEPLKTLSKFRKINNKVTFGQNVLVHGIGKIKVGDSILLL